MKIIVIVILFTMPAAYSQTDYGGIQYPFPPSDPYEVQFGLKFGLGLSDLTLRGVANYNLDYSMRTGYLFGTTLGFKIKKDVMLQTELLYVVKGASYDSPINAYDYSLILKYFEFPFLLKYYPEKRQKTKPNIYAGPVLGFLLSSTVKTHNDQGDITSAFSVGDYGIALGAGLDLVQKSNIVIFDARLTLGLNNINKSGGDMAMKNVNFTLATAIAFF